MSFRKKATEDNPIVIKKYANRRLYNTETSCYVTLEDLCDLVKNEEFFLVYDAKTGEDITRSVLSQIIFEQEAKGQNLLPVNFMRKIIGFYGKNATSMLPQYLEASIESFIRNQEQMQNMLKDTFEGIFPVSQFEQMGKQNIEMMKQTFRNMFAPFDSFMDTATPEDALRDRKK
jgi:polyhydroxyalkanoate synthesis repressor PhaR